MTEGDIDVTLLLAEKAMLEAKVESLHIALGNLRRQWVDATDRWIAAEFEVKRLKGELSEDERW